MRVIVFLCAVAIGISSCAENPLDGRVGELEEKVAQMEAEQTDDLLRRLDEIPVTAGNDSEIADLRAKITQQSISTTEFNRLVRRVEVLEGKIEDWESIVSRMGQNVYAVLHGMYLPNDDIDLFFLGTAFAVGNDVLVTNAHIIDALNDSDVWVDDFNNTYGTDLPSDWILVRNLTTNLRYMSNWYIADYYGQHPDWDWEDLSTPDVGLLWLSEGRIYYKASLCSRFESYRLRAGAPIGTVGFPGELQGGLLADLFPIATFKEGTISALRPPLQGEPFTAQDAYVVQHNLDLTGGTSGSPIFDRDGAVIAVNNAGIDQIVFSYDGVAQVSQGALGFGIRTDIILETLAIFDESSGKPLVADAEECRMCPFLDGREIGELNVFSNRETFRKHLTELAANGFQD